MFICINQQPIYSPEDHKKYINKIMDITSLQRDTGFDTEGIYDLFTNIFF
jgi:hypothetical protein